MPYSEPMNGIRVELTKREAEIVREFRKENDLPNNELAARQLIRAYAKMRQEAWMVEQFKAGQAAAVVAEGDSK